MKLSPKLVVHQDAGTGKDLEHIAFTIGLRRFAIANCANFVNGIATKCIDRQTFETDASVGGHLAELARQVRVGFTHSFQGLLHLVDAEQSVLVEVVFIVDFF